MTYYFALMQVIVGLITVILIWQTLGYFKNRRLWKKVRRMPLPSAYKETLEKIPHYRALPDELKEKMRPKILFFIETKEFVGVKIDVTDEMKAVVAFYACLMVVEIPNECFNQLVTILIYPYEVITEEIRENGGVYSQQKLLLEGQSIDDTVVIAWRDAKKQAYHLYPHNVVVHELAHVLDFEDGVPDGVPPIQRSLHHRWTKVLYRHFKELQSRVRKNRSWEDYKILGSYAATNEAEFFAVVSEIFFQKPLSLKRHFPGLYDILYQFYGIDTAKIFKSID
ncbi:M90 family metallopeptidase [Hydrogenimonas sp.]